MTLTIDLRALPYSFIALVRQGAGAIDSGGREARLIGRAEVSAKEARIHLCDLGGLHRLRVMKAQEPALFRSLKKGDPDLRLLIYREEGDHVRLD